MPIPSWGWRSALQGRAEEAIIFFRRVAELDPGRGDARNNLGCALRDLGRLDEAGASFREAVRLDPDHPMALSSLVHLLSGREKHGELVEVLQDVIRLRPEGLQTRLWLGEALMRLERFNEAVSCFEAAIAVAPDSPGAHDGQGRALAGLRRFDEAVVCFQRSLDVKPDQPHIHHNLGCALRDLARLEEAEASFREAVRLDPGHPMALASLSRLLTRQLRHGELAEALEDAVRRSPDGAEARLWLGDVLARLERFDEAVARFEAAVALAPDSHRAHNGLGSALGLVGRFEEALTCYERAIRLAPDVATAHLNRSLVWLMHGDYARGWPEYDWRLQEKAYSPRSLPGARWRGEPLVGRTILLHAEQGLGDTLQFVRYAPLVKQRGSRVMVECQRSLVRLVETCRGVEPGDPARDAATGVRLPLPAPQPARRLRHEPGDGPRVGPVPHRRPRAVAQWGERLGPIKGLRVGIAWQGEPKHPRDRSRSFPLPLYETLARVNGVRLISLQRGAGVEQLRALGDRFPVIGLGDLVNWELKEMWDTPAIMMNLDLVIAPDSAPAHLAGALGVPVWIPLSFIPDFRWMLGREDSPWYPTARLFRQGRAGGWDEPFDRMAEALAAMVASRRAESGGPTR